MFTLTTSIQRSTGSSSQSNQAIKISKIHPNQKREVKQSLFVDDILNVENPKDYTQRHTHTHKLLELINYFSKVVGYKLNIQKYVSFLYINKQSKKAIKETIPFRNNKKLKNKPNHGFERLIYWKLQNHTEKNFKRHK